MFLLKFNTRSSTKTTAELLAITLLPEEFAEINSLLKVIFQAEVEVPDTAIVALDISDTLTSSFFSYPPVVVRDIPILIPVVLEVRGPRFGM